MTDSQADRPSGGASRSERPPDDAPSGHSSLDIIVPEQVSVPTPVQTVASQAGAPDTTFRDAVEYQGRAQDLQETGLPSLLPDDAYDNVAEGPSASQPASAA